MCTPSIPTYFTKDPTIGKNHIERPVVLSLITKKVSEIENECLLHTLEDNKIESVVLGFQAEKSLGINGITSEMMRHCWSFLSKTMATW